MFQHAETLRLQKGQEWLNRAELLRGNVAGVEDIQGTPQEVVEGEHIYINRWHKLIAQPPFVTAPTSKLPCLTSLPACTGQLGLSCPCLSHTHTQLGSPRQLVCSAQLPAGNGMVLLLPLQVSLQLPPHPGDGGAVPIHTPSLTGAGQHHHCCFSQP